MKGTPYYDMAVDAGYRGQEAEQMAAALEADHRKLMQLQDGCDICGGAHSNEEHMANSDSEGRYSPPPSEDV